ncbi:Hypothetical protein AA314_00973 [Archangium gephyra]|uniref:Uncharacterized protein n=1 Tax=Archangium gephyra TaxID=48 RepID=A0AAC8Q1Y1_9BACT|nr:Hypothetical protein AA314_00973 [Archangium gephyra]
MTLGGNRCAYHFEAPWTRWMRTRKAAKRFTKCLTRRYASKRGAGFLSSSAAASSLNAVREGKRCRVSSTRPPRPGTGRAGLPCGPCGARSRSAPRTTGADCR